MYYIVYFVRPATNTILTRLFMYTGENKLETDVYDEWATLGPDWIVNAFPVNRVVFENTFNKQLSFEKLMNHGN